MSYGEGTGPRATPLCSPLEGRDGRPACLALFFSVWLCLSGIYGSIIFQHALNKH